MNDLVDLLLGGLDSGEPIAVTEEDWDENKRRLTERPGNTLSQPY